MGWTGRMLEPGETIEQHAREELAEWKCPTLEAVWQGGRAEGELHAVIECHAGRLAVIIMAENQNGFAMLKPLDETVGPYNQHPFPAKLRRLLLPGAFGPMSLDWRKRNGMKMQEVATNA